MRLLASFVVTYFALAPAVTAQSITAQDAAWQARSEGTQHFASASNTSGQTAIVSFKQNSNKATLFISGLWKTRPLDLRLWVAYPGRKRGYIDTYRFAKIVEHRGKFAYTLVMPASQLRPLRGGERLVIEDLNQRTEIPLTGSAKAITTAQKSAASN